MIQGWTGPNVYQMNSDIEAIKKQFSAFNTKVLVNPTIDELAKACKAKPLGALERLVIVENPEKISNHTFEVPLTTKLIILNPAKQLKAALKKAGQLKEFGDLSPAESKKLVKKLSKEQGVTFENGALDLFLFLVGNSEIAIRNEFSKLSGVVGLESVSTKVTRHSQTQVFTILENVFKGEFPQVNAFQTESEIMQFLSLMTSQLRLMIIVKHLKGKGFGPKVIAKKLNANPYRVSKVIGVTRNISYEQLDKMFLALEKATLNIRFSRNRLHLQKYLVEIWKIINLETH